MPISPSRTRASIEVNVEVFNTPAIVIPRTAYPTAVLTSVPATLPECPE